MHTHILTQLQFASISKILYISPPPLPVFVKPTVSCNIITLSPCIIIILITWSVGGCLHSYTGGLAGQGFMTDLCNIIIMAGRSGENQ